MTTVSIDDSSIRRRFPNVNLNPVVVLEDIMSNSTTLISVATESISMDAWKKLMPQIETNPVDQDKEDDVSVNANSLESSECLNQT